MGKFFGFFLPAFHLIDRLIETAVVMVLQWRLQLLCHANDTFYER
jgi:hypothetical protein